MSIQENEVIGQIRHALTHDPKLDAPKITITFLGDSVSLAGILDTEEEVLRAGQVAKAAAPGIAIDNGLTVSMTQDHANGPRNWQDSEIQRDAEVALMKARDTITTRPASVSVEVVNGFAHLRGSCSTLKDRQLLIEAVASVPGVKRVIADDFEVAPFGSADDIRLRNLASERLQQLAPDLSAYVTVDVRNRGAHLVGNVRTLSDKQRAEECVMQQPGIKIIHNELGVYQDPASPDPAVKIEQEVRHAIAAAGLPKPNIHVFYASGVLTLDGEVETPDQHRLAVKVANETLKRIVGDVYQISDSLKIDARRGKAPTPESDLLQRGTGHPGNSPVIPIHSRDRNKAAHTDRIEDRVPETQAPLPKRSERD